MATAEQRLQRLEDESAIRDLAARFADAGTRAAHDDFKALWLPWCPMHLNFQPIAAPEAGRSIRRS